MEDIYAVYRNKVFNSSFVLKKDDGWERYFMELKGSRLCLCKYNENSTIIWNVRGLMVKVGKCSFFGSGKEKCKLVLVKEQQESIKIKVANSTNITEWKSAIEKSQKELKYLDYKFNHTTMNSSFLMDQFLPDPPLLITESDEQVHLKIETKIFSKTPRISIYNMKDKKLYSITSIKGIYATGLEKESVQFIIETKENTIIFKCQDKVQRSHWIVALSGIFPNVKKNYENSFSNQYSIPPPNKKITTTNSTQTSKSSFESKVKRFENYLEVIETTSTTKSNKPWTTKSFPTPPMSPINHKFRNFPSLELLMESRLINLKENVDDLYKKYVEFCQKLKIPKSEIASFVNLQEWIKSKNLN